VRAQKKNMNIESQKPYTEDTDVEHNSEYLGEYDIS
jgi:hypothetical protein